MAVRPDRVNISETIHGERRKNICQPMRRSQRSRRAREHFVIREIKKRCSESRIGRDAHVHAPLRPGVRIFRDAVRRHKRSVQIPSARARTLVHFNLRRSIAAIRRKQASRRGKRC